MAEDVVRLGLYESKTVVPLQVRGPGVYVQKLEIAGNSILSSLFVKQLDLGATVTVTYQDFGVGGDDGEAVFLDAHVTPTVPGTDRILVTRVHNKPYITITITGGNAQLGIYVSVISSFASDLDSALKAHLQNVNLVDDRALPQAFYDTGTGKWYFGLGTLGVQHVQVVGGSIAVSTVDTPTIENLAMPVAGTEYSYSFPAGTSKLWLQARQPLSIMRLAWSLNGTNVKWKTLWTGSYHEEKGLDPAGSYTVYLQSSKANTDVELLSWA